jgi:hypothetical protein
MRQFTNFVRGITVGGEAVISRGTMRLLAGLCGAICSCSAGHSLQFAALQNSDINGSGELYALSGKLSIRVERKDSGYVPHLQDGDSTAVTASLSQPVATGANITGKQTWEWLGFLFIWNGDG